MIFGIIYKIASLQLSVLDAIREALTSHEEESLPLKPTAEDLTSLTHIMPMSEQDDIELAARAAHRDLPALAERYRVHAGYGGLTGQRV